jgi:hypothetical protein
MERRQFLTSLITTSLAASKARAEGLLKMLQSEDPDEKICMEKFAMAKERSLELRPIGEVVADIGKSFVGTEYVAHTLEQPGEEHLVVNLRGMDCVSFYENSLCLGRCVELKTPTFEAFKHQLQWIRYRDGVINGYPSRIHYTSDYFYEDVKKGIWRDLTKELGGVPFTKKVDFMSTHSDAYAALVAHPEFIPIIRKQEEAINAREKFYIPKEKVAQVMDKMQNGDILGTTTSKEGLDTSHTGMILWQEGEPHFMHAPLSGGSVQISKGNLSEYLLGNASQTGIMIVRPLEPS